MAPHRLIIVDDEPVILRLLAGVFESDPYEVVACADCAAARDAIADGVDVLLTDKNLPDGSGLDLMREAKRLHPGSECVMITGYASVETVIQAMQLEAFDYIVKPPKDINEVRLKVWQAMEKVRLRRENDELFAELTARNAELEHALDQLRSVGAELVQSEKLAGIGTLAAGVAHEVSSPLFGIMGLAEAIPDESDRGLVDGYAREIVEFSKSIREIVQGLVGYSRTASTEYPSKVDLRTVISDAARLVGLGAHPDCLIQVDCPESLLVAGRSTELQQVFVNLLKNAVEAMAGRVGRVRVSAWQEDEQIEVRVEDEGCGIPSDRVGQVFDPFFTTKATGEGTGLGLNIVYRIVTKYRGTITVESRQGVGTRFVVCLPRASDSDEVVP